jgi:non-ribosomal peptide synthetase component F
VVGTVINGRRHADLENIIGFFVNMLAIKTRPAKDRTFSDYLMEVKDRVLKAFENQDYQFEELVNKLGIPRQSGRHPLVDAVFAFQDREPLDREIGEINTQLLDLDLFKVSHFDLMLYLTAVNDSINGVFEYSTDLFKSAAIEELSHFYMEILEQVIENPKILLQEIRIDLQLVTTVSSMMQEDAGDWDI